MNILIVYENSKKEMDLDTRYIYNTLHYINKYEQINISEITLSSQTISYLEYLQYIKKTSTCFNGYNTSTFSNTPFNIKNIISIIDNICSCDLFIVVTSSDYTNHKNIETLFDTLSYIFLPHQALNPKINNIVTVIVSSDSSHLSKKLCHYLRNSISLMGIKDLLFLNLKNQNTPKTEWNKVKLKLIAERVLFCIHNSSNKPFICKLASNYVFFRFNSYKYSLGSFFKFKNTNHSIVKSKMAKINN